MPEDFGYGQATPSDSASDFNAICFLVRQMMARMSTMKLVKVVAVHSIGRYEAAGTVDVLPLVMQVDGNGNTTSQGTVFGIPWFRLCAGSFAIICDPKVDDIGFVVCADRDTSSVRSSKVESPPGSFRKFDVADSIYVGGILAGTPSAYIAITDTGIKIADQFGHILEMSSGGATTLTGDLNVNGSINVTGEVTHGSGAARVTLTGHQHLGNNLPPTPGH